MIAIGFLIVIIGISVPSLSILLSASSITMVNAQVSSDGDNNHKYGSGTDKQMGICVTGISSRCNGDTR